METGCGCTCSSGQLKRRLCVVLRPILQGALHIRSVIQQQLWRVVGGGEGREGEEGGETNQEGE